MAFIFVDVEAEGAAPCVGHMTEFGAVERKSRKTFHGKDDSKETFKRFENWLWNVCRGTRPIFVSDNPAFDWQWINDSCWKHLGHNPFGHSARRISDFYAGLTGDWNNTQKWKALRITVHDHNPVHDALGNCEAFDRMLAGER
jgi:hypothetical protein